MPKVPKVPKLLKVPRAPKLIIPHKHIYGLTINKVSVNTLAFSLKQAINNCRSRLGLIPNKKMNITILGSSDFDVINDVKLFSNNYKSLALSSEFMNIGMYK